MTFESSVVVCARVLGISALIAVLFVVGCKTTPSKPTVGVAISPAGPVTLEQGGTASLTAAVSNDTATDGVTWSLTGAGSLTGNTTTAVTYNAPASVTAASAATVKATSVADSNKTATFTVNLVPPPAITPATLPGGNVGTPYNQTVTAAGGVAPYTLSITGTQITGVTFTAGATSATLSGIPTAATTYGFTVSVKDSGSPAQTTSALYSVVIGAQLPLSITTTSLAGGALNAVYAPVQINATGGFAPYSFGATGLPTGLVLSSGGSLTGTPTVAGPFSASITVTDSEPVPATNTVTLPLTITAPPLALSPGSGSLPNATQNAVYTTSLTPSGGVGPYTITLDGTSAVLPAGLNFNGTTASTTAATITGTPTVIATTSGIIVDVTDSEAAPVTTKFTYSLTVGLACGTGSESLLSGQYAFALRGFDAGGPVAVGGIFNADGAGKVATITGIEDVNSNTGASVPTSLAISSANSSYSVGSDHRGCLTINTTAGTQMFRFSLAAISGTPAVASLGHMVQFDATGSNTAGELRLQNPNSFSTSAISGSYAFGLSGPDTGGGKLAMVGLLTLSGGSVVTTGASPSVVDMSDKGNIDLTGGSAYPTTPIALSSGSLSIGANGRGSLTITLPGTHGGTANVIVYPVSTTEFLLLAGDPQAANGLFAGSAMKSVGPFSTSSMNAPSILYTTGVDNNGSTDFSRVTAGILTPSSGTASFSGQQNSGGTLQAQTASGGITYAVATDGRVTFGGGGGGSTPVIYLVSANKGFALFIDSSSSNAHVESGFLEPQSGGPFGTPSASGTYAFGTIQPDAAGVSDESGIASFSAGQVSVTSDNNSSGTLNPAGSFGPLSYSVDSTGLGVIPAGCNIDGTTGQNGTCQSFFYVLSPTKAVVVDATSSTATTNPHLQTADQ